jgi:hypothetical protein
MIMEATVYLEIARLIEKPGYLSRYFTCDWLQEILLSEETGHLKSQVYAITETVTTSMTHGCMAAEKSGKIVAAYTVLALLLSTETESLFNTLVYHCCISNYFTACSLYNIM